MSFSAETMRAIQESYRRQEREERLSTPSEKDRRDALRIPASVYKSWNAYINSGDREPYGDF